MSYTKQCVFKAFQLCCSYEVAPEATTAGREQINLKGKCRTVLLQKELRKKLLKYAKKQGIETGYIFRTKNGKPLDRSNICHDMKYLCASAKVDPQKVFPHNIRHLFARAFYAIEKNLAHLADVLGHSRGVHADAVMLSWVLRRIYPVALPRRKKPKFVQSAAM